MNELIAFPVRVDFDGADAYATTRIFDSEDRLFLNIRNSERYRTPAEILKAKATGEYIVEALNTHSDNRWRDVKDELPKESGAYFISIADSDFVQSAWYIARKQIFVKLDGSEAFTGVTAWMPQMLRYQPAELEVSE